MRRAEQIAATLLEAMPAKDIKDVLPEMIRIAKEGDEFDRIVRLLVAAGWTENDLWREVKKLTMDSYFTLTLQNRFRDHTRHNMTTTRFSGSLEMTLRWLKKSGKA